MHQSFEWDDEKAAVNLTKHGVPFEYAAQVFFDPAHRDQEDDREDYGEQRRIAVGQVNDRLLVITYTLRGETIRIISARKATRHEQRNYRENR